MRAPVSTLKWTVDSRGRSHCDAPPPMEAADLWARADRTPWKAICWRFGISRATANRRWQYGLRLIAWRLNGRRVPAKRSRSFVVESVRRAG